MQGTSTSPATMLQFRQDIESQFRRERSAKPSSADRWAPAAAGVPRQGMAVCRVRVNRSAGRMPSEQFPQDLGPHPATAPPLGWLAGTLR
jgi:hypothetical protein